MKKLFFLLLISLFICQVYKVKAQEIENKIMFLYLPKDIGVPLAIRCGDLPNRIPHLMKYKFVTDSSFVKQFNNHLNSLQVAQTVLTNIDTRIECWFKFKGEEDLTSLCLGEHGGIFYNGQLMVEDTVLVNMVKDFVWDIKDTYDNAYDGLINIIKNPTPFAFERAVFTTENAYWNDKIEYADFIKTIRSYVNFCKESMTIDSLTYEKFDKEEVISNASIFKFMTDTTFLKTNDSTILFNLPFTYNTEDDSGKEAWENTFVMQLMDTHKGNCRSLSMLYKILAERMNAKAWLALAPNHLYIKLYNKQQGWYNTELTSATFPSDAWLAASCYIHVDAIRNGIYMDTLSQQQSVALCFVDLAMGYQRKVPENYHDFVLKCCGTALEYFPNYINALLLKAETLTNLYQKQPDKSTPDATRLLAQATELYSKIHELGYRKTPKPQFLLPK